LADVSSSLAFTWVATGPVLSTKVNAISVKEFNLLFEDIYSPSISLMSFCLFRANVLNGTNFFLMPKWFDD
jgi:hypothetical protein